MRSKLNKIEECQIQKTSLINEQNFWHNLRFNRLPSLYSSANIKQVLEIMNILFLKCRMHWIDIKRCIITHIINILLKRKNQKCSSLNNLKILQGGKFLMDITSSTWKILRLIHTSNQTQIWVSCPPVLQRLTGRSDGRV